jgi:hypothetical protein
MSQSEESAGSVCLIAPVRRIAWCYGDYDGHCFCLSMAEWFSGRHLICGRLQKQLKSILKFVAEITNLIGINEMSNAAGMLEKRQLSIGWEAPTLTKHSSRVAHTAGGADPWEPQTTKGISSVACLEMRTREDRLRGVLVGSRQLSR